MESVTLDGMDPGNRKPSSRSCPGLASMTSYVPSGRDGCPEIPRRAEADGKESGGLQVSRP